MDRRVATFLLIVCLVEIIVEAGRLSPPEIECRRNRDCPLPYVACRKRLCKLLKELKPDPGTDCLKSKMCPYPLTCIGGLCH